MFGIINIHQHYWKFWYRLCGPSVLAISHCRPSQQCRQGLLRSICWFGFSFSLATFPGSGIHGWNWCCPLPRTKPNPSRPICSVLVIATTFIPSVLIPMRPGNKFCRSHVFSLSPPLSLFEICRQEHYARRDDFMIANQDTDKEPTQTSQSQSKRPIWRHSWMIDSFRSNQWMNESWFSK